MLGFRMRSRLILLVLIGCLCLAQGGCVWLMFGLSTSPRAVAQGLGSQMAYGVSEGLTGPELDSLMTNAETIETLDQIIADHPNAANTESLRVLRENIAEETGAEAAIDENGLDLKGVEGTQLDGSTRHLLAAPVKAPSAFDRRNDPFEHATPRHTDVILGGVQHDDRMSNNFTLERPDAPDQRPRTRDQWRHTTPPGFTLKLESREHWPLFDLTGGRWKMGDGRKNGATLMVP